LGSFSANDANWQEINAQIEKFVASDRRAYLIKTADLNHNGDRIHFDSEGQRRMGKRFADAYIQHMNSLPGRKK
jgi:lysophospholipase L1-like esterase